MAKPKDQSKKASTQDYEEVEFGGPVGTAVIIAISHFLLYYVFYVWRHVPIWVCTQEYH